MVKAFVKRTKDLFSRGRNTKEGPASSTSQTPPEDAKNTLEAQDDSSAVAPVTIVGAGIVGLVLALALDKHCGIKAELYEQAQAFHDDVGAGMGMYPNGLRVIRDISPELLQAIQEAGYAYVLRRYERHDGTEVATSEEKKLLSPDAEETETHDLQPIGIRRWKLQKILYQAVQDAGMKIHFNKGLESLELNVSSSQKGEPEAAADLIRLQFKDGTIRITKLLLGADGSKSQVRTLVSDGKYQLEYTGTTCIMGSSKVPRQVRGLCLPSSETTRCHGAFYPTGEHEQCFQFHFPTTVDQHEGHASSDHEIDPKQFSWGGLTHVVGREECNNLADKLLKDGWDEKFTIPLRNVDKALKIRCSTLEPHLESFVFAGRIALVGDSAHPPVPYLGQGAQQGLEDAGTLALLLQHFCTRRQSSSVGTSESKNRPTIFSLANVGTALKLYNQVRLPRTTETLNRSKLWGKQQQKRAENQKYNEMREENIRRDVFYHETLPILLPAVRHDYREGVITAIKAMEAKKEEQAAKQAAKQAALAQSHPASSPPNSGPGPNVDAPVDLHLLAVPEETVCY